MNIYKTLFFIYQKTLCIFEVQSLVFRIRTFFILFENTLQSIQMNVEILVSLVYIFAIFWHGEI